MTCNRTQITMTTLTALKTELQQLADPIQKKNLQRFFKTAKGEYGEGDVFFGIKVPLQRKVAKKYLELPLTDLRWLLNSNIHEHRFTALVVLINQYNKTSDKQRIFDFYIQNRTRINNWDLVDISAPKIVGVHLLDNPRKILYQLAKSPELWDRRIAIIATHTFIKHKDFIDTLHLAKILLNDQHDLIHKAVGWMLREVGKQELTVAETFLNQHYQVMPRTMLRYAIEKFTEENRKFYLAK